MRCFVVLSVLLCVAKFTIGAPAPQFPDTINFGAPVFFPPGFGELIQQLSQVASSLNALGTRFGSTLPQQGFTNYAVASAPVFPGVPDDGLGLRLGSSRPSVGAVATSSTGGTGSSFSSVSVSNSNGGRPVAVTVTQENNQRPIVQVSHLK